MTLLIGFLSLVFSLVVLVVGVVAYVRRDSHLLDFVVFLVDLAILLLILLLPSGLK